MKDKVLAAIRQYGMIPPGACVLVGVSGGADSVALLHFLQRSGEQFGCTVVAAHVNHGLRGEESDRDERFVRALCERLGVELAVTHLQNLAAGAKESGQCLEEAARDARYRFLEEEARKRGAQIATAHTMDDSIETTLFHLARGTGLRGLRGIPPVRGKIVRPLITCTRREIEAYCAENGLDYVTDSSNLSDSYARNRIRHTVLPPLREVHPGLDSVYPRMAARLAADEDYLGQAAAAAVQNCRRMDGSWDAKGLAALHPALRYRALSMILAGRGWSASDVQATLLLEHLRSEHFVLELIAGQYVELRNGVLRLYEKMPREPGWKLRVGPGEFALSGGRTAVLTRINCKYSEQIEKTDRKLLKNALDYDKIYGDLVLRQRREGDKIRLCGRGVGKTLKKLFQEAGVPADERQRIPVLADGVGVVWVAGFGCDERVAADASTKTALTVQIAEGNYNEK
ncbi:tRNA lysidine(34) synthetase TilS [Ligaoa zhengdingensis]|uniref:tRNA lysidine(34) synthetase TilS n=3 Tax=Ligaoa zhengdingensis TaxID=2763658 RepID=UPI0031B9F784